MILCKTAKKRKISSIFTEIRKRKSKGDGKILKKFSTPNARKLISFYYSARPLSMPLESSQTIFSIDFGDCSTVNLDHRWSRKYRRGRWNSSKYVRQETKKSIYSSTGEWVGGWPDAINLAYTIAPRSPDLQIAAAAVAFARAKIHRLPKTERKVKLYR